MAPEGEVRAGGMAPAHAPLPLAGPLNMLVEPAPPYLVLCFLLSPAAESLLANANSAVICWSCSIVLFATCEI